jgi:hypothetical protein
MTTTQHGLRIALLMVLAACLLGAVSARTDILFADGLRYVSQAQRIESGAWRQGLTGSIDQPIYPLAIAATHSCNRQQTPEAWQAAGQTASVVVGVLLVIPLYLVSLELFGAGAAWLAVVLFFGGPLTGHILADVLSEGTFLLFWLWGLWSALRFLRQGSFVWLPLVVLFSGLAYLTRPEGVMLPAALVVTLLLVPFLRSTRLHWSRWCAAIAVLVLGPALLLGPYVAAKGGIASKPAVARLLGMAPRSAADAVERAEPLDNGQSEFRLHLKAAKVVFEAVRDLTTPWLLPLAAVGLALAFKPFHARSRVGLFIGILLSVTTLALVRLYVTGGYCSPRHAIVLGALLTGAAAHALERGMSSLSIPGRRLGLGDDRFTAGPVIWALVLAGFAFWSAPSILQRLNHPMVGYKQAGNWLADRVGEQDRVADATGWSLFYGQQPGYTFATLHEAAHDPKVRWVVVREAHLVGPWWYCRLMREMVGTRTPVAVFPQESDKAQARVLVFDLETDQGHDVAWTRVESIARQ